MGAISEVSDPQTGSIQPVFGSQERRGSETCNKFESTKRICSNATFQDGRNPYLEGRPGDWLTKLDPKDTYFTIPIRPGHKTFLRFLLQERTYKFNCLPFGLSSAPWVFTKTLKPVYSLPQELGVHMVVYTDEKLKKIRDEPGRVLREESISARTLSGLLGKMNAAAQVIPPPPLFYRHLEMILTQALNSSSQSYETKIALSQDCIEELSWWITNMS